MSDESSSADDIVQRFAERAATGDSRDCFVAALLAMTKRSVIARRRKADAAIPGIPGKRLLDCRESPGLLRRGAPRNDSALD